MDKRLKGKVAVITGGGGGIGRSVALAMAAEGASIVVNDFNTGNADKVVAEIKKAKGNAVANYDSVTTVVSAQKIIKAAISNFGRVDILVQCAGNICNVPTLELTQEQWDSTLAVHIGGHFACAQAAAREMVQQKSGGTIINFASRGAFPTWPDSEFNIQRGQSRDIGFHDGALIGVKEIRHQGQRHMS